MLHPHKTGGSSVCRFFAALTTVSHSGNCLCKYKHASLAEAARWMGANNVSFCNIEHAHQVPAPEEVLTAHVLSGTDPARAADLPNVLVTLREPWSTYTSNYRRSYHDAVKRCPDRNFSDFSLRRWMQTPKNVKKKEWCGAQIWESTPVPNFLVRFLSGHKHGATTGDHLEKAKTMLNASAIVFVEDTDSNKMRVIRSLLQPDEVARTPHSFPHVSNSACSQMRKRSSSHAACHPSSLSPDNMNASWQEWAEQNQLDIQLYAWAWRRRGINHS